MDGEYKQGKNNERQQNIPPRLCTWKNKHEEKKGIGDKTVISQTVAAFGNMALHRK